MGISLLVLRSPLSSTGFSVSPTVAGKVSVELFGGTAQLVSFSGGESFNFASIAGSACAVDTGAARSAKGVCDEIAISQTSFLCLVLNVARFGHEI